MNDIARDFDISITTMSFILNGKAKEMRISDKLTQKVLDYVKEKNYKPNTIGQSLRTGKSKIKSEMHCKPSSCTLLKVSASTWKGGTIPG